MAGELNPAAAIGSWSNKLEIIPTTTTTTTTPTPAGEEKQAGPTLGQKRQRRPSVRLGDIKPLVTTTSAHQPRPKPFPNSRTRPLTNLDPHPKRPNFTRVHYDDDDDYPIEDPIHNNNNNYNNNEDDEHQQQHSPVTVNSADDDGVWHRRSIRSKNNNNNNNNTGYRGLDDGVRKWLLDLGLSRYAPLFEIHEVDDHVLPHLTLEDLKDMGVTAVGSRRKLHTAILNLRKPS